MKKKIKIQIKNRWTDAILFEYEKENNTIKDTLAEAVKQDINLNDADLIGADLIGTNLIEANLKGANLEKAYLSRANLVNADLRGANLIGADLRDINLRNANLAGAYLAEVNLAGANLNGANLIGADLRDANLGDWGKLYNILVIGPLGSRNTYTTCYKTDKGIFVQCGCFKGTLDEFIEKVKQTHRGNIHERDYLVMVEFVKIKF